MKWPWKKKPAEARRFVVDRHYGSSGVSDTHEARFAPFSSYVTGAVADALNQTPRAAGRFSWVALREDGSEYPTWAEARQAYAARP